MEKSSFPADPAVASSNVEMSPEVSFPRSTSLKMWNPFFLRSIILVVFLILFAAMAIALGLLYHFSAQNDGISTQISKNQYSWTYGPTAGEISLPLAHNIISN